MYRHIKSYELRYTDVDAFDNLKLSALLSFLEESACLSADELGFGYNAVGPANFGFVLANIYIELSENIKLGDVLTVHTWPLKPTKVIFLRDSELYVKNKMVGRVTARWCMINTKSYCISPASAYFDEGFFDGYNTERSIKFNSWKIPTIVDGKYCYSKLIKYSDYDHYFHANNTKYADFLLDAFSVDEIENKYIKSVQITFVKQCKEGETVDFVRKEQDGFYIIEGRVSSDLRVQMRLKFNEL